jgi:hypothetical protein
MKLSFGMRHYIVQFKFTGILEEQISFLFMDKE